MNFPIYFRVTFIQTMTMKVKMPLHRVGSYFTIPQCFILFYSLRNTKKTTYYINDETSLFQFCSLEARGKKIQSILHLTTTSSTFFIYALKNVLQMCVFSKNESIFTYWRHLLHQTSLKAESWGTIYAYLLVRSIDSITADLGDRRFISLYFIFFY